ncbi:MAG: hypothetical protein GX581_00160 [Syntrophomonadaceae bacterium]|jgi:hypothetical protein|nr:hypothetical protein [Syntrophomonadaceae bacterium]
MSQIFSTNFVSHKILENLKSRGYDQFTLRPFNRHKPDNTIWWLVPSTEWPSYKHGKIAVFKSYNSEDFMVGLYFEKGLSAEASEMSSQKLRIQDDWAWNIFIKDIGNGNFEKILAAIFKSTGEDIKLILQAIPVMDKEQADKDFEIPEAINTIEFKYNGIELEYIKESAKGEMVSFKDIGKFEDLLKVFKANDMEWYWIDFYAVIEVTNSEWSKMESIVPIMINNYEEIF